MDIQKKQTEKIVILIINNKKNEVDRICDLFLIEKTKFFVCENAKDILIKINKLNPDLIFIDYALSLPINAFELCRILNQKKTYPIIITKKDKNILSGERAWCVLQGADELININSNKKNMKNKITDVFNDFYNYNMLSE